MGGRKAGILIHATVSKWVATTYASRKESAMSLLVSTNAIMFYIRYTKVCSCHFKE